MIKPNRIAKVGMSCLRAMGVLALALVASCTTAGVPPKAIEHNRVGTLLLASSKLIEAEAQFALALEYHDNFAEAYNNLGLVAMRRGDMPRAKQLFTRAIKAKGTFAEAYNNLGLVILADRKLPGRLEEAAQSFHDALRIDPGYAGARYNLATTLISLGRAKVAIEELRKLVAAAPRMAEAYAQLALAALQLDRRAEAEEAMRRAVELAPRKGVVQRVRGDVFWAHRALDEAAIAYRLAATFDTRDAAAMKGLGIVRLAQKRNAEAIDALASALERDAADLDIRFVFAAALSSANRHADAEREVRHVLSERPKMPTAIALLADVLWDQGRKEEARVQYRQFLAQPIGPLLEALAQNARRRLASVER